MENKNNGKGIFYGVIGVATLIVAIIGATFAYFTATAGSNDAINVTSMENPFDVSLSVSQAAPSGVANHLLPLDDSKIETAMSYTNPCLDENDDQTCAIYELQLRNNSSTEDFTIDGNVASLENGFTTGHIKFRLYSKLGSEYVKESKIGVATHNEDPTEPEPSDPAKFEALDGGNYEITLSHGENKVYYLVVWLTDTGADDQIDDQNKNFIGQITFTDADPTHSDTKITANFSS